MVTEEEANAYVDDVGELEDGPTTSITIQDQTIREGDDTLVVENVFLGQPGYVAIHDARTRLFGEEDVQTRILKSMIGITPVMGPGPVNDVEVQLFSQYAPAVERFDRSGPLDTSQPVIAVPHINDTGPEFRLEVGGDGRLQGDAAFTRQVVRTLECLAGANDLALITVKGDRDCEVKLAKRLEKCIRDSYCSRVAE